ncbi:hypothetical protein [Chitinophaga barathri]|uniref:hypothetical protein n=1 Tax=Chitinophaga barathri TaxID=1647451 RepID=UPI000F5120CA|nr:hypothetical protein [Chitinophaga barathri]
MEPTLDGYRRWLAIYQPKHEPIRDCVPAHVYSVLDFEIEKTKMDDYFSGEDLINERRYYAKTEEGLFSLLESLNIDLGKFTYPWKCDYPL